MVVGVGAVAARLLSKPPAVGWPLLVMNGTATMLRTTLFLCLTTTLGLGLLVGCDDYGILRSTIYRVD